MSLIKRIALVVLLINVCVHAWGKADDPKIVFIGLWDRAFTELEEASRATGIPVSKTQIRNFTTSDEVQVYYEGLRLEQYNLIYVLQINQVEAQALNAILKQAKQANPSLVAVELDQRSTHQELLAGGMLKTDPLAREYWTNFGLENLKRLLTYSSIEYLQGAGEVQPPSLIAQTGIYHPEQDAFFQDFEAYRGWYSDRNLLIDENPWVVIILKADYVIYKDARIYDALISELEKNHINVCPIFGDLSDLRKLIRQIKPDLMILQHHSGPESTVGPGEQSFLEEIGVPYLYGAGLLGNVTVEDWKNDIRSTGWAGYASMARHEFHGIIEPQIIGAKENTNDGYFLDVPIQERLEHFVSRVMGWLNLQTTAEANKKIAIIYFHKYMGKSDVGRSAMEMGRYFNVPKSLEKTLHMLQEHGYTTDSIPSGEEEMLDLMLKKGRNIPAWSSDELDAHVKSANPVLVDEAVYLQWFKKELSEENQKLVIEAHGPPPGKLMVWTDNGKRYIVLPGNRFGNVFMAPQPSIGVIEDSSLVKSRVIPPSHNFLAFYWWLRKEYKADAFIHFGAFGSDLSLPGKEIFLSKDCFPDVILGNIPNVYVWPIENIGIGVIAKRRVYAVLIDHLVAQILPVDFSVEFSNLENSIHLYFENESNPAIRDQYREAVTRQARQLNFIDLFNIQCAVSGLLTEAQIMQLRDNLSYYQIQNSPLGMHVLGEAPPEEQMIPSVANILWNNTSFFEKLKSLKVIDGDLKKAVSSAKTGQLLRLLMDEGVSQSKISLDEEVLSLTGVPLNVLQDSLKSEIEFARQVKANFNQSAYLEKENLLAALDGKYISPGSGGTPLTNPGVLPTGRNLYGINPYQIPSQAAWETARKLMDETLHRYREENGRYPKRLAFSLTGMETFRDMGVMEAQILYLIGVRPLWNAGGLVTGMELMSSEELNRPRIDPLVSIGSIYLKNFPFLIEYLDFAIQTAALAEGDNYLRTANEEILERLLAEGDASNEVAAKLAGTRIFGSNAGTGGARLIWLLPRSGTWDNRQDIVKVWENNRSNMYGKEKWSEQNKKLYGYVLAKREMIITDCGNNLYGPLTNHHYPEEAGGLALAAKLIGESDPEIVVQDLRDKKTPSSRPLEQVIAVELMATALNQTWIQSQMGEGYQGATQFMQIADNLFQWEAVNEGTVSNAIWENLVSVYIDDKYGLNISKWFDENNPFAFQQMASTMLEANRKQFWKTTQETRNKLAERYAGSVVEFSDNAGPYSGGNMKFYAYVINTLEQMGNSQLARDYRQEVEKNSKFEWDPKDFENR